MLDYLKSNGMKVDVADITSPLSLSCQPQFNPAIAHGFSFFSILEAKS
jgi:hypothetical protein